MSSAFVSDGVVELWPVTRADLPRLAGWRNDPEIRQRLREWRPLTDADQDTWFARISGPDRRDFMFVVRFQQVPVGVVGLCYWNAHDATAEISFYLGEPSARGQGCTTRALTLLHDWGFEELGLERVWAEAYSFNEPSIGVLAKLGYREEGRLRSHVRRHGKRHDSVMLGLLRDEWLARPRP